MSLVAKIAVLVVVSYTSSELVYFMFPVLRHPYEYLYPWRIAILSVMMKITTICIAIILLRLLG